MSESRVIQAPVGAAEAAEVIVRQAEAVLEAADTADNSKIEENATFKKNESRVLFLVFYMDSEETPKVILRASDKVNPRRLIVESMSLVVTYILCIS